jgi:DNA-binding response OmpR family regulator
MTAKTKKPVIEDEPGVSTMMAQLLPQAEHQLLIARPEKEGMELARKNRFDA